MEDPMTMRNVHLQSQSTHQCHWTKGVENFGMDGYGRQRDWKYPSHQSNFWVFLL